MFLEIDIDISRLVEEYSSLENHFHGELLLLMKIYQIPQVYWNNQEPLFLNVSKNSWSELLPLFSWLPIPFSFLSTSSTCPTTWWASHVTPITTRLYLELIFTFIFAHPSVSKGVIFILANQDIIISVVINKEPSFTWPLHFVI